MTKMKEMAFYPDSALYQQEIEALVEVLEQVLVEKAGVPKNGTFMLWGKSDEVGKMEKLIHIEFDRGPKKHFLGQEMDSKEMAKYVLMRDEAREEISEKSGAISYFYDSPLYLDLDSKYGHFGCAYYVDGGGFTSQTIVYYAMAKALAILGGHQDEILINGAKQIYENELPGCPLLSETDEWLNDVFAKCESEKLAIWKDWFGDGEDLELFFENFQIE